MSEDFHTPEVPTYHGLHASYAVVVLVLVATGLLIQYPDLRAALAGGYGRTFATVHEWAGVAMLALPAIALVLSPRKAIEVIEIRSYQRTELRLHAVNVWFTLLGGAGLIVTGFLMWFPRSLPDSIPMVSQRFDVWLTAVCRWCLTLCRRHGFLKTMTWDRVMVSTNI